MLIIETSAGQTFRVTEPKFSDLAHVYDGIEVKRVKGEWVEKKNARPMLVRKTGCRVLIAA